jgi:Mg-chelatase subunit ChlD
LEDYKQDNFVNADKLIDELQSLLKDYREKQLALSSEANTLYQKLQPFHASDPYHQADKMMRKAFDHESAFLDLWKYNLNQDVPTSWIEDKIPQSILETESLIKEFAEKKPNVKYPASSMVSSFAGGLGSILQSKRSGLDGYNNEARKSDRHSNDVYNSLINYYNGVLVSFYNNFFQYSQQDKFYGIKAIKYVHVFEIRNKPEVNEVSVKPFKDIPRKSISVSPQPGPISKTVFESLDNYIGFINETWRQTRYMQMVLRSFNSSASYYGSLETFSGRGGLHFDYKNYKVPLSDYQKTTVDSKVLPPEIATSLNDQATVLLNILKEMDQLAASLEIEATEKRYEKDRLKRIYEILDRQRDLFIIWDAKKEQVYNDVRSIYESYPPADAKNSWFVSGKALYELTDLDHEGLFKAKAHYYLSDSTIKVSTDQIDRKLRKVIADEYTNLKGIQKIGRNNGNCPYTPYEDLPQTSKRLSERLNELKPPDRYNHEHPYHNIVYHYNDIVDNFNKFCELSKEVMLLKTIKQPELFFVKYPDKKPADGHKETAIEKPVTTAVQQQAEQTADQKPPVREVNIVRDTVYIEKHDTIYISEPGENLRSMEGYATNNMILLLDVSGSMKAPEKLPLLKKSVLDLLTMMRQEDQVGIVVYSGKAKVLLRPTSFKEENQIKKVIERLKSEGKTDGNAGLKLAYKVADENYIRGGNNRIILATDGEFPINEESQQLISRFAGEDIFLSVFNFGKSNSSAKNLEKLAAMGKGNYEYITRENAEMKLIREAKSKRKK